MNSRLRGSLNLRREIATNNLTCHDSLAAIISTNITTRHSSHIIRTPWHWYWYTGTGTLVQRRIYLNNKAGYRR